MGDRTAHLRDFFARYVAAAGRARDPAIGAAFAATPREPFAGPGPWAIHVIGAGYIETPDDDPAFLYQDTLVALDAARGINIGQPSAHAHWLDALGLRPGETAIQVGAGTGYYTTILAHLVGAAGRVHAYEIDAGLAARAKANLAGLPQAEVVARSGLGAELPQADAIYVCAGLARPDRAWLDALRPGARLMFPLQAAGAAGGMLKIRRPAEGGLWPARFVSNAAFIACQAPQDAEADRRLTQAFARGDARVVRSFRTDAPIDDSCWFAGEGWWLSRTDPAEAAPPSSP